LQVKQHEEIQILPKAPKTANVIYWEKYWSYMSLFATSFRTVAVQCTQASDFYTKWWEKRAII